jgi:hypothetical protein
LGNQLSCCITSALAQVLVDDTFGGVFAAAATGSNRQFVLYVEERASAAIDSLADVFIGHGMAYADVHQGLFSWWAAQQYPSSEAMVIGNENDCQLQWLLRQRCYIVPSKSNT